MDGGTTVAVKSHVEDVVATTVQAEPTAASISFLLGTILCASAVTMDEQRRQEYLELTQELLSCNSNLSSAILEKRQEWVDDGWVEMLEKTALHGVAK